MAVSIAQYVDLLVKKLYGVSKTDTSTNKSPSNEAIASPSLNRGDTVLTQADQIPTIATATANLVVAYQNGTAVQCTADNTTVPVGGIFPTWLTGQQNWIPQEFGATYAVKAYVGPPGAANIVATGTLISDAGSGGSYQWFFDYEAGLLNFIGETIPPSLTSGNVVYVTGYQYVGLQGVTNLPGNTNIGNLNFTDTTISSTGNLVTIAGTSGVIVPSGNTAQRPGTPAIGTVRFNTTDNLLETWDGLVWVTSGSAPSSTITDQQITPDGTSNTYSLVQSATAATVLVSINGTGQMPNSAYTVDSLANTITFSETPLTSDHVDIRFLASSIDPSSIHNSSGNTSIYTTDTPNIVFTVNSVAVGSFNSSGVLNLATGQGVQLPTFSTANTSAISAPADGQIIYVTDGDSGNPCLAVYSGGAFKRVSLGANISI